MDPKSEIKGWQLFITDRIAVHFYCLIEPHTVKLPDGVSLLALLPRFLARADLDSWPLVPAVNNCSNKPLAFHAGLRAFSHFFAAYSGKALRYEEDEDIVIDFRTVLQNYAALYGCDPNEIASQYSDCRAWLLHTDFELPPSLDTLIANTKMSASTKKVLH